MTLPHCLITISFVRLWPALVANGSHAAAGEASLRNAVLCSASVVLLFLIDADIRKSYPGITTLCRYRLAGALASALLCLGSGVLSDVGLASPALDLVCALIGIALTLAAAATLEGLIHPRWTGDSTVGTETELIARMQDLNAAVRILHNASLADAKRKLVQVIGS